MRFFRKNLILSLLVFIAVLISCDKDPTGPEQEPDGLSRIIVYVYDDEGKPFEGINIRLYYETESGSWKRKNAIYTDIKGEGVFDSLAVGNYYVDYSGNNIEKYRYVPSLYFRIDVNLKENETKEVTFRYPAKVTLEIQIVEGPESEPLEGISISIEPFFIPLRTNEEGRAVVENIPPATYRLQISNHSGSDRMYINMPLYINIINGKIMPVVRTLNFPPEIKILSPKDNEYTNGFDVNFVGKGMDFEDGRLPDTALNWYSDIEGELGTGKQLMVDRLSPGRHKIKFIGIDSRENASTDSIYFNVYSFDESSYYPFPYEGYWKYLYDTTNFSVVDVSGETEYWTQKNINISVEESHSRNSIMYYMITKGNESKDCSYSVIDYYEFQDNSIYVSKTIEQLIIYEGIFRDDEPIEQIDIETIYTPQYLIFKDHMDLSKFDSYETTVTSDITYNYYNRNLGEITTTESIDVNTSYEVGEPETIETNLGTFDTVPLTITTGDAVRKWWLAKGIGIVKLEFNTFEFPLSATLYETNMFSFAEKRPAQNYGAFSSSSDVFLKELHSPPDTPERMLELCRLLRGMCPQ